MPVVVPGVFFPAGDKLDVLTHSEVAILSACDREAEILSTDCKDADKIYYFVPGECLGFKEQHRREPIAEKRLPDLSGEYVAATLENMMYALAKCPKHKIYNWDSGESTTISDLMKSEFELGTNITLDHYLVYRELRYCGWLVRRVDEAAVLSIARKRVFFRRQLAAAGAHAAKPEDSSPKKSRPFEPVWLVKASKDSADETSVFVVADSEKDLESMRIMESILEQVKRLKQEIVVAIVSCQSDQVAFLAFNEPAELPLTGGAVYEATKK